MLLMCTVGTSTYDASQQAASARRLGDKTASFCRRRPWQRAPPVSLLLVALTGTGSSPLIGNDVTHLVSLACCCCCCWHLAASHCLRGPRRSDDDRTWTIMLDCVSLMPSLSLWLTLYLLYVEISINRCFVLLQVLPLSSLAFIVGICIILVHNVGCIPIKTLFFCTHFTLLAGIPQNTGFALVMSLCMFVYLPDIMSKHGKLVGRVIISMWLTSNCRIGETA